MQETQSLVNTSLVAYIAQNRDSKSRDSINRVLLAAGHAADEVDDAWRSMGAAESVIELRVVPPLPPLPPVTHNIVAAAIAIGGAVASVLTLTLPWYTWHTTVPLNGLGRSLNPDVQDGLPDFATLHWPPFAIVALSIIACALIAARAHRSIQTAIFFATYLLLGLELTAVTFAFFGVTADLQPGIGLYTATLLTTLVASVFASI